MGPFTEEPWKTYLGQMEGKTEQELIQQEQDTRAVREAAAEQGSEMLETLNALVGFVFFVILLFFLILSLIFFDIR